MNEWSKAIILTMSVLLVGMIGYHMAQQEKLNDRLKRMETFVAVCGDVASFFAPNEDLDEMAELSKKRMVRR